MVDTLDIFEAAEKQIEEESRLAEIARFDIYDLDLFFENAHFMGDLDPVVGNHETRCTTALAWLLSEKSVIIRGESGTGKTRIMNGCVDLMWGDEAHDGSIDEVYPICEATEKGLQTWDEGERILRARWCIISELQNVKKQIPMIKSWTEGKAWTSKKQNRQQTATIETKLVPLPIITSLAQGNEIMKGIGAEMRRRFLNVWTTNSKAQNEKIKMRKAQMRLLPEEELLTMSEARKNLLRAHIFNAIDAEPEVVVNPCIMEISKAIPSKFVVSNSYTDYFFNAIESVARFYYNRNMWIDKRLVASPADNKIAWIIFGPQLVDACLGIPFGIGRAIIDIVPEIKTFEGLQADSSAGFDIQDISDALEFDGRAMEMDALTNIMEKLSGSGNIKQNQRTRRYFKRGNMGEDEGGINWSKMIDEAVNFMRMSYPDHAAEFENDYCTGKGLVYVHPFTGVSMNLLTDTKVREDTEDERLNLLNEKFQHLTLSTIEISVDYFNNKTTSTGPPPKVFFMNDIPKRVGMVDTDELSELYDTLREEIE